MKDFPAFFVLVKTNFDKIIGSFIDSKFESTRNIESKFYQKTYKGIKQTNS